MTTMVMVRKYVPLIIDALMDHIWIQPRKT